MGHKVSTAAWHEELERDGYTLFPAVYAAAQIERLVADLTAALQAHAAAEPSLRSESGSVYAARNLLAVWPEAANIWRQPSLIDALEAVLGPRFGLVRGLFFDKPPERTWSLPWHKDMTIAVRDAGQPSAHFTKPTRKAGVPHVLASEAILQSMLTLRIHLDAVTQENGPLKVIPGSHHDGKTPSQGDTPPRTILAEAGDVLLIRPLVEHCSGESDPRTMRHRRVIHLEFAAAPELPDGVEWYQFMPGR